MPAQTRQSLKSIDFSALSIDTKNTNTTTMTEEELYQTHIGLLNTSAQNSNSTEMSAAPIFSAAALHRNTSAFDQYGFLAGISSVLENNTLNNTQEDPRLFFNVSTPSSSFICGSQGSGKSHTLSCLLENCLIKSQLNQLKNPLAALVLHFDQFTSDEIGNPCEAAYISSSPDIKVRVLCAPTNLQTIKRTYAQLDVSIEPLRISQNDLNTKRMLNLMAVNPENGPMPLYMHTINRILRELRLEQQANRTQFNYGDFKRKIVDANLTLAQRVPLDQRLDTLESFMPSSQTKSSSDSLKQYRRSRSSEELGNDWSLEAGTLTILDLSCPCVTPDMACALFNMCVELFLEQKQEVGRIIALDEAHKYMNSTTEALALTATLISSIRLQRHLGARVFVSTQEPTISPALLDLCSMTIVHRFTSPEWLHCLKQHIAAIDQNEEQMEEGYCRTSFDSPERPKRLGQNDILSQILKLNTGEALLFAPTAIIRGGKMGNKYLRVRIRDRLTTDGGKSVLAV